MIKRRINSHFTRETGSIYLINKINKQKKNKGISSSSYLLEVINNGTDIHTPKMPRIGLTCCLNTTFNGQELSYIPTYTKNHLVFALSPSSSRRFIRSSELTRKVHGLTEIMTK